MAALVFAAALIISVTAYAETADVLPEDESLMPPEPVTEIDENLMPQEPVSNTRSDEASKAAATKGKTYKLQDLLMSEKIGHDEFEKHGIADKIKKGKFKKYEIGKRIACFYQRKIGNAIVEKDFLNYQFDRNTGEFIEKNGGWRDDLPETLPADMLTLEEALAKSDAVRGEVLFGILYFMSPDSDVFPLDPTPENPCWAVHSTGERGYRIVTVIDAVTGEFLGNGVPPPASGFSMTGPFNDCVNGWISKYESAEYWFDVFPVSDGNSYSGEFPSSGDIQSYIQDPSVLMFYEIAHGGSTSFRNECNVLTRASDIHSWMASRQKMLFAFIASCGGMCSTGSGTLSHEFRKGSAQHTTTVGYCDMAGATCSGTNCWVNAEAWQNTLFYRMALGNTVKEAFDIANAAYPGCFQSNCMRFEGDPNYRIPTFTNIGSQTSGGTNHIVEFCGMENGQSRHGKAICRGDWQLDPCNWTSSCSTGWEYDPDDFYYGCNSNCGN